MYSGGYLTGKYLDAPDATAVTVQAEPGSHFDPNWAYGNFYISRYTPTVLPVRELKSTAEAHGINLAEVAVRWLMHHSQMRVGDHGIIVGASKIEQLEKSLQDW